MSVSYYFSGVFEITPPISEVLRDEINGVGLGHWHHEFHPWEISEDCKRIYAPGDRFRDTGECEENLALLVAKLTALGHAITGEVMMGEADGDEFWKYTTENGILLWHEGHRDEGHQGYTTGLPVQTEEE